ncbi:Protein of unknown function (DUF506 [Striga hermonthica]|uniref:Uncharacterized protein n=1 Tax=Striga hermonthica TaxID=68872 RepID=A0A9N7NJM3_STRHE|nr:Protein of unknown function (DUF506 [Striga hermonthica]
MPYPMKIQPIDFNPVVEPQAKPMLKLKFRRLFERPFSGVLRASAQDKPPAPHKWSKDCSEELEPSSVRLARMVQNFIEETNDKQRCGRKKCNCFNGSCTDSSDEDPHNCSEPCSCSSGHAFDVLKSLVPCSSACEKNLLADTAKIVNRNKIGKQKDELCRKIVVDGLIALGYKASICRSKWEKTPSFIAGEYEYVDATIEGERLIIDVDFRSGFEIARPTKAYRQVLQTLPNIFVGKADRLEKIVTVVSEAAKQSLKKRCMPVPPWRKAGYVKAKWLSSFTRLGSNICNGDEFVFVFSDGNSPCEGDDGAKRPLTRKWEPLKIRPKNLNRGVNPRFKTIDHPRKPAPLYTPTFSRSQKSRAHRTNPCSSTRNIESGCCASLNTDKKAMPNQQPNSMPARRCPATANRYLLRPSGLPHAHGDDRGRRSNRYEDFQGPMKVIFSGRRSKPDVVVVGEEGPSGGFCG